jgi:hypothetical protein
MAGYDIGCGFSITANRSALLGPKIRDNQLRFCVGSFHGHAHCRSCQLDWHPLYIPGTGLEDFEGNERIFSESNSLAASTRHASEFHRKQAIIRHFDRWNLDKYAELSNVFLFNITLLLILNCLVGKFMLNNYRQAADILATQPQALATMMVALNIPSEETFRQWHMEERQYLQSLKKEPEREVLEFEYLKNLMRLQECRYVCYLSETIAVDAWFIRATFETISAQWLNTSRKILEHPNFYSIDESFTRNLERARIKGLDSLLTMQKAVEDLETKLEIERRWTAHSEEWKSTAKKHAIREYQLAVDKLEGLVVSRLFEMTKLNQSGLGKFWTAVI